MLSRLVSSFRRKDGPSATRQRNRSETDEDSSLPDRNPYSRPQFLLLSSEEEIKSCDFISRPIITPKDVNGMPFEVGYAE